MTAIRRQTVFAGLDQPQAWPALRGRPRPERLDAPLDTLPGVGPTVKRRLAKLGLETIRDLLEHRPRRYEDPVPEVAIAALGGEDEVAIAGEVLNVNSRRRGRLTIVTARISDGTAAVGATWFNQPWLADQLKPGVHVRLRGRPGRYGFDVRSSDIGDGEATADFAPVYPASEEITPKKIREIVAAALPHAHDYWDPLPAELRVREGLPLKSDALVAVHHPGSAREAETGRQRLAFDELLLLQIGIARRAAARERTLAPVARRAGRADRALPQGAAVRADAVPGAGDPRDRRRPRARDPDAAAAAGRRRLRQDGRRAVRAPARGRERPPGRADGADGDARRAALPHHRRPLSRARRHLRAADERAARARARGRARAPAQRRGADRGRHACADPAGGRLRRPRRRRRRRAAPLRRRAAQGARRRAAARTCCT